MIVIKYSTIIRTLYLWLSESSASSLCYNQPSHSVPIAANRHQTSPNSKVPGLQLSSFTNKLFVLFFCRSSPTWSMWSAADNKRFQTQVQAGLGFKHFHRLPNIHNKVGKAKVAVTADPAQFTRTKPQLHYVLRLCQSETQIFTEQTERRQHHQERTCC